MPESGWQRTQVKGEKSRAEPHRGLGCPVDPTAAVIAEDQGRDGLFSIVSVRQLLKGMGRDLGQLEVLCITAG
ncbi:Fibronectin Type Iii Domain-Containing Protein 3B [Manis pentadactyla]|nr:Fibronectin Type Iii Domain-Containing Protein 3B [Manis pentadactyla]